MGRLHSRIGGATACATPTGTSSGCDRSVRASFSLVWFRRDRVAEPQSYARTIWWMASPSRLDTLAPGYRGSKSHAARRCAMADRLDGRGCGLGALTRGSCSAGRVDDRRAQWSRARDRRRLVSLCWGGPDAGRLSRAGTLLFFCDILLQKPLGRLWRPLRSRGIGPRAGGTACCAERRAFGERPGTSFWERGVVDACYTPLARFARGSAARCNNRDRIWRLGRTNLVEKSLGGSTFRTMAAFGWRGAWHLHSRIWRQCLCSARALGS